MPSTRAQSRISASPTTQNATTRGAVFATPTSDPERVSMGPTPSPISLPEDRDAGMAPHPTSVRTSPSDEATMLQGDELSHGHLAADRAADFQEETTRARRDAREQSNLEEEEKQSITHEAGPRGQTVERVVEAEGPEQIPQESSGVEAAGEHTVEDPKTKREATPVRSQASWIDDAVSCAARNKVMTSSVLWT